MATRISAAIVGGTGYTGGETLRLLLNHPLAEAVFVSGESRAGEEVARAHTDLAGETDLRFARAADLPPDIDVLFLCLAHGESRSFLEGARLSPRTRVIDLSRDFRHASGNPDFIYGLPEAFRDRIRSARKNNAHVANPGCFATCLQLGLLPLAARGLLTGDIHSSAITGSTGAGKSPTPTTHYSWRAQNAQVYQPFTHPHAEEAAATFRAIGQGFAGAVRLIPYRGSFTRGLIASSYTPFAGSIDDALGLYREFYASHPFVRIVDEAPDVKQVVNTNRCLVHLTSHGGMLLAVSVIDNLLKGAAGQAVQNMNLLFGLDEEAGLKLKPTAF